MAATVTVQHTYKQDEQYSYRNASVCQTIDQQVVFTVIRRWMDEEGAVRGSTRMTLKGIAGGKEERRGLLRLQKPSLLADVPVVH